MEDPVGHDPEARRFYISLQDGVATLEYRHLDNGVIDFYSTFVPPSRRGEGIGGRLVQHALKWARRKNFLVRASCPFVDDYISHHQAFANLRL